MRKSIMIDMDDVICQGGFESLINEFLGTNYKTDDFTEFYMQNKVPKERREEFFKFFCSKNLYDYSYLLPDAYDVIKWMNDRYDVYIGTSYIVPEILEESGAILQYKYEYLRRELPFLDPYKFVFLGDKSVLRCNYKIDDKSSNLENAERKFLFSAFHNHNISDDELNKKGIERVYNFAHLKQILMEEQPEN